MRRSANADKRVALLYYNYPHGSETIGTLVLLALAALLVGLGYWRRGVR